ncbi:MAG: hypothetical protein COW00_17205 [Bdellovibrio sp. CG12_big_fil_rev_8_21_14_0_65_39_13]|nr:MAG: hypothetical protein COW78_00375 [Bdellovibrio sp. CG22_combo_CG10-13_8_21_14_all_39_27]PIQ58173.1 MAG: hypothetical protein COW00_17205 [Bdellovibrio sp. CG12_big_fil_rev_8_21_14_0_65_39_13]PIR34335.1 MAG: hypothetical protein COV37_13445 [Bdellovibrio sp. CG11_big_fil_rev_8_21_14_0_20_39_38]PJB52234.1 MAG: hypothetical protein CO099_13750 [Bdellovibrio sp. CG_4_9_14_3_um_filter_39_7]
MSGTFQKKTSNFFITFLIGLIVVSFMFTGYESMRGTPDTVAKVGSESIKIAEYQREYDRQLEFYRSIFGGQALSTQQIENMGIKTNALKNIVQQKLMLILADEAHIPVPPEKVKEEIKKMPYFLTNNQFDINRYKAVLNANRLSPQDFEMQLKDQVKAEGVQTILSNVPLSQNYLNDIEKFKKEKMMAQISQFPKESLRKLIPISNKEANDYLAVAENQERIKSLFADRKSQLDQQEEVKARHILLKADEKNGKEIEKKINDLAKKVTLNNFKDMAKKYTEDPSGKDNGGDLGWFAKGRMVPEFEKTAFSMKSGTISKPIKTDFGYHIILVEDHKAAKEAKYEDHNLDLAKEMIRKTKNDELKALATKTTEDLKQALSSKNWGALDRMKKQFDLTYEKDSEINRYDGTVGSIFLQTNELKQIFEKGLSQKETYAFDNVSTVTVVATAPAAMEKKKSQEDIEKERNGLSMALSRKLVQNILKNMEEQSQVKIYADFLK